MSVHSKPSARSPAPFFTSVIYFRNEHFRYQAAMVDVGRADRRCVRALIGTLDARWLRVLAKHRRHADRADYVSQGSAARYARAAGW